MNWIEASLSPEQRRALARSTHNASVLAAAGSGKTRTLVHLLAQDLATGVPASSIVAFTFTTKAAEELLARIHTMVATHMPEVDLSGMYIGTIHSWCLDYLAEQSDFYNFAPIDELHNDALVSRLYDTLKLQEAYGLQFPKAVPKFLADLEVFYNEHLTLEGVPSHLQESIGTFVGILRSNRLMTFGDMVRYATHHLQENGPVSGLRALYVDEYQDVNPAQVALIESMLPYDGQIVVVGDDLQCIYNWRGSDVTRILNFPDEFSDVSVHRISTNYRARPAIVEAANKIAENISLRDPEKVMQPYRDPVSCETVNWVSLTSEEDQVRAVVNIVERHIAEGVPYNKIAVLLRSVVSWGEPFVDALKASGIPVQCPLLNRGGTFIDEVLLPLFDWLRKEHGEPHNELDEAEAEEAAEQLWESVRGWMSVPDAEDVFWDSLHDWLDKIEDQKNEAYDVRGRLYDFLDSCGIRIRSDDSNLMLGLSIASQIIRSVEEIHRRRIQGQQRRSPRGVMSEVFFALLRNMGSFGESIPIDTKADGVLVTTIHQAKGLEWPVVIMPMLMKRRFPVNQRGHGTSFPDEIAARYGTSLDDERRLFYVAATRAKERLFLVDPVRGNERSMSAFLRELRDERAIEPTALPAAADGVWRIDGKDLAEDDPAPLRIGLSDLLIYVECPYQYGLRRMAGVQPSIGDELGFGRGLHEVIQRRSDAANEWTPEELTEQVNDHVNLPYMSERGEAEFRKAVESRMTKLEGLGAFEVEVESEIDVEVPLGGGIVHGIVDSVQLNEDGSVLIRDWKSNVHDDFVPRYERQLRFYALGLSHRGRQVERADIVDVGASDKRGALVASEVDIGEREIGELVDTLQRAVDGINEGDFTARPSHIACASCDMYRICAERSADV